MGGPRRHGGGTAAAALSPGGPRLARCRVAPRSHRVATQFPRHDGDRVDPAIPPPSSSLCRFLPRPVSSQPGSSRRLVGAWRQAPSRFDKAIRRRSCRSATMCRRMPSGRPTALTGRPAAGSRQLRCHPDLFPSGWAAAQQRGLPADRPAAAAAGTQSGSRSAAAARAAGARWRSFSPAFGRHNPRGADGGRHLQGRGWRHAQRHLAAHGRRRRGAEAGQQPAQRG